MRNFNSLDDLNTFITFLIDYANSIGEDALVTLLQHASAQPSRSEWMGELKNALIVIRNEHADKFPKPMIEEIDQAVHAIDGAFRRANSPFS